MSQYCMHVNLLCRDQHLSNNKYFSVEWLTFTDYYKCFFSCRIQAKFINVQPEDCQ